MQAFPVSLIAISQAAKRINEVRTEGKTRIKQTSIIVLLHKIFALSRKTQPPQPLSPAKAPPPTLFRFAPGIAFRPAHHQLLSKYSIQYYNTRQPVSNPKTAFLTLQTLTITRFLRWKYGCQQPQKAQYQTLAAYSLIIHHPRFFSSILRRTNGRNSPKIHNYL